MPYFSIAIIYILFFVMNSVIFQTPLSWYLTVSNWFVSLLLLLFFSLSFIYSFLRFVILFCLRFEFTSLVECRWNWLPAMKQLVGTVAVAAECAQHSIVVERSWAHVACCWLRQRSFLLLGVPKGSTRTIRLWPVATVVAQSRDDQTGGTEDDVYGERGGS